MIPSKGLRLVGPKMFYSFQGRVNDSLGLCKESFPQGFHRFGACVRMRKFIPDIFYRAMDFQNETVIFSIDTPFALPRLRGASIHKLRNRRFISFTRAESSNLCWLNFVFQIIV